MHCNDARERYSSEIGNLEDSKKKKGKKTGKDSDKEGHVLTLVKGARQLRKQLTATSASQRQTLPHHPG